MGLIAACRYGGRFPTASCGRTEIRRFLHGHSGRGQLDHDDAPTGRIGHRFRPAGTVRPGSVAVDIAVVADRRSVHLRPDHNSHEADARQGATNLSATALHLVRVRGADEAGQHIVTAGG